MSTFLFRTDWLWVESEDYSMMVKFDLYCGKQFWRPLMTSIIFVGWAIGAPILGWVADKFGRRRILFFSIFMAIFCMVVSVAAHAPWGILILRIISGFFVPGMLVGLYVVTMEICPAKRRNLLANGLQCGWGVILAIQALISYYVRVWKTLLVAQSIPFLILLPFYYFVPESLRYLNTHGRSEDAMWELKRIARFNGKKIPDNVEILQEPEETESMDPRLLFKSRRAVFLTLIQSIDWIFVALAYYAILLASENGMNLDGYLVFAIMSLAEIPGTIICVPLLDYFGRRPTVVAVEAFSAIACIIVGFIPDDGDANYARIVLAAIARAMIGGAFNSIYLWTSEIHPTTLRSNAMGWMQIMGRIGSVAAPWVVDSLLEENKMAPFILVGGLLLIAACLCWFLPETRGSKTNETLADYYGYEMKPAAETTINKHA